jgi:hypothetical protein
MKFKNKIFVNSISLPTKCFKKPGRNMYEQDFQNLPGEMTCQNSNMLSA